MRHQVQPRVLRKHASWANELAAAAAAELLAPGTLEVALEAPAGAPLSARHRGRCAPSHAGTSWGASWLNAARRWPHRDRASAKDSRRRRPSFVSLTPHSDTDGRHQVRWAGLPRPNQPRDAASTPGSTCRASRRTPRARRQRAAPHPLTRRILMNQRDTPTLAAVSRSVRVGHKAQTPSNEQRSSPAPFQPPLAASRVSS